MSQVSTNQKIYYSIQRKLYQVRAEFNGRTTQRYQYTVTESKIGSVWKYLTVDKWKSQEIYAYVIKGQNLTEIYFR
jgi:L-amino acid N-acyltransferase YncA